MRRIFLLVVLSIFVTSCAAPFGNTANINPAAVSTSSDIRSPALSATPTTLYLATIPSNATQTFTPFQPSTGTPTPTLAASATPLPDTPTPDFDPDALLVAGSTPQSFYAPPYAPEPVANLTDNQTVTYLLLGSDKRSGQKYFRTDTIIVVAIRPWSGQVTLISVPRDLYVYIPTVGMDRINTAYEYGEMYHYSGGGEALVEDTFLYNLGIRIDHMAIVDFDGFRRMVDTLDGVDVPVVCSYTDWRLIDPSYDPNNEDNWALYTVDQGLQHMDGDLALWYARSRLRSSDFDRGRRSQEVLRALYTRALQVGAIGKIPELYDEFSASVITDLGLANLLQLAPLAFQLKKTDIRSYYIGSDLVAAWTTPGGASVQLPNPPAIQSMLQEALSPSDGLDERSSLTIEVRNGTSNSDWDVLAAERLNYAGYDTQLASADRQDYSDSLLYDLSDDSNPDLGRSILSVLGLPSSAYVTTPLQSDIDFVFIVGSDYQPCFNPVDVAP